MDLDGADSRHRAQTGRRRNEREMRIRQAAGRARSACGRARTRREAGKIESRHRLGRAERGDVEHHRRRQVEAEDEVADGAVAGRTLRRRIGLLRIASLAGAIAPQAGECSRRSPRNPGVESPRAGGPAPRHAKPGDGEEQTAIGASAIAWVRGTQPDDERPIPPKVIRPVVRAVGNLTRRWRCSRQSGASRGAVTFGGKTSRRPARPRLRISANSMTPMMWTPGPAARADKRCRMGTGQSDTCERPSRSPANATHLHDSRDTDADVDEELGADFRMRFVILERVAQVGRRCAREPIVHRRVAASCRNRSLITWGPSKKTSSPRSIFATQRARFGPDFLSDVGFESPGRLPAGPQSIQPAWQDRAPLASASS